MLDRFASQSFDERARRVGGVRRRGLLCGDGEGEGRRGCEEGISQDAHRFDLSNRATRKGVAGV
jgi:hypothetical protein